MIILIIADPRSLTTFRRLTFQLALSKSLHNTFSTPLLISPLETNFRIVKIWFIGAQCTYYFSLFPYFALQQRFRVLFTTTFIDISCKDKTQSMVEDKMKNKLSSKVVFFTPETNPGVLHWHFNILKRHNCPIIHQRPQCPPSF